MRTWTKSTDVENGSLGYAEVEFVADRANNLVMIPCEVIGRRMFDNVEYLEIAPLSDDKTAVWIRRSEFYTRVTN